MKKVIVTACCLCLISAVIMAQDEEEKEKGFKKENLFAGGSVSLAFYGNTFLAGASPVFGYSITSWLDAGIVANYNYASYWDVSYYGDKLHQSVYGGGLFTKLYPVRFLFAQAQVEHNFIHQKYIPPNGGASQTTRIDANSVLVGGGYTTGREPGSGRPYFYLAVLFDVGGNVYSPYTDGLGRVIPIFRGGIEVPLFQKR